MSPKTILSLPHNEALDFFMKSEQFHNFELPEYFNFDILLAHVKQSIGVKKYEDCLSNIDPENLEDINIDILLNKDGQHAVRPIVLPNPFLYYFLCREICNQNNWRAILDCFNEYKVPTITACALPIIPNKKESFHKSTTILNWWNAMEQRSIELLLEYRYMFVTDITNCYGTVNPQTIEWALTCKNTNFESSNNVLLAKNIQKFLRAFQKGRNIGIPQGSVLFDFIGEIILGYSDLLLFEALEKENINDDYEIIRYRDDYRIFCNNKDMLECISYKLQSVLETLNFRMNSQKTKISDSIITDSVKPDKLFYIYNTPIFNKKECDFDGIQKHLLYILMFSREYPNCGQLRTMLSDLDKRIIKRLESRNVMCKTITFSLEDGIEDFIKEENEKAVEVKGRIYENVKVLSAIATQIAVENVSVCHYALRIISRIVDSLEDVKRKQEIINKVFDKLCKQPNSDYNQLWLQNITYTNDKKDNSSPYSLGLCKLVMDNTYPSLWNNTWLKPSCTKDLPINSIVDKDVLKEITPVINFRETRVYDELEY